VWISHTVQAGLALSQIIGKVDHSPYNCNPNGNPPFWPPFAFPYPPYQWSQPNNGDVFQHSITITNRDDGCTGDPSYAYVDDVVFGGPSNSTTIVANLAK